MFKGILSIFCLLIAGRLDAISQVQSPLRVLFFGAQEPERFHDPLARHNDIKAAMAERGITLDFTGDFGKLTDKGLVPYDAVLVYTMHPQWGSGGEIAALKRFVQGGKGLMGLHTATVNSGNPEWVSLIGAAFENHNYGNPIQLEVAEPRHEAIKDVPGSIPAFDESYYFRPERNAKDRTVLQMRKDMNGARADAWTWVRNEGDGRVYYSAAGHDEAWRKQEFHKQVEMGLRWVSGEYPVHLNPSSPGIRSADFPLSQWNRAKTAAKVLRIYSADARLICEVPLQPEGRATFPYRLPVATFGYPAGTIPGRTGTWQ